MKSIKQMAEEARVRVRSARREGLDAIKKAGKASEDAREDFEREIQKLTDTYVKKIDDAFALKEADIMKV